MRVVAEKGPVVTPLQVVTLASLSSGEAVAEVDVDPTLGTPMLQENVIKKWKEVRMGELFETNGLSAVLQIWMSWLIQSGIQKQTRFFLLRG